MYKKSSTKEYFLEHPHFPELVRALESRAKALIMTGTKRRVCIATRHLAAKLQNLSYPEDKVLCGLVEGAEGSFSLKWCFSFRLPFLIHCTSKNWKN